MILLMCCKNRFANILLRIVVSIFIKEMSVPLVFVSCSFFVWVWNQDNVGIMKILEVFP